MYSVGSPFDHFLTHHTKRFAQACDSLALKSVVLDSYVKSYVNIPLLLFVVLDGVCTVPRVMLNIGIQDGGHHHENVITFDRGEGGRRHFIPLARAPTILYPGLLTYSSDPLC